MQSTSTACPAGTPPFVECFARTGTGVVPGLGNVSESYTFVIDTNPGAGCPGGLGLLGSSARFTVAGKGEIDLSIDGSTDCFSPASVLTSTPPFTVTGGSGAYAGASGSGMLRHNARQTFAGVRGDDEWVGRSSFPGSTST